MISKKFLSASSLVVLVSCLPGAVGPGVMLGECEATLADQGLSFMDFVTQSVLQCGADALGVIDAFLASGDPKYAKYKSEALAAKQDVAKMNALKAHVAAAQAAASKK